MVVPQHEEAPSLQPGFTDIVGEFTLAQGRRIIRTSLYKCGPEDNMMAETIMGDREHMLACRVHMPGKFLLKVGLHSLKTGRCPRMVRHDG
jgi:hypothetical protein